ncbi:MAG: hypothetical protein IPJ71_00810 [Bdellovibrionales bacterium]|nr:hypothetical protein [Bdellovibrionales bacterium]
METISALMRSLGFEGDRAVGAEFIGGPKPNVGGDLLPIAVWLFFALAILFLIVFLADGNQRKFRDAIQKKLEALKRS